MLTRKAVAMQFISDSDNARDRSSVALEVGESDNIGTVRETASNIGVKGFVAEDASTDGSPVPTIAIVAGCLVTVVVFIVTVVVSVLWCRRRHNQPNSTDRTAADYDIENWQEAIPSQHEESTSE